ncbi:MAG: hypothetical protein HY393_00710 [Candidatus Diapherotrites archaeon]|nr:hypothetical protein [Candidatus Diapherotrites archaeon]
MGSKGLWALIISLSVLVLAPPAFASVSYSYYTQGVAPNVPHWKYFSYSDLNPVGYGAYGYSVPVPYGPYWALGGWNGLYGYNGYGYGYGFGSAYHPYVKYGGYPIGYPYNVYPVSDYYYNGTFVNASTPTVALSYYSN